MKRAIELHGCSRIYNLAPIGVWVAVITLFIASSSRLWAETAKDRFTSSELCYQKVRKDSRDKGDQENWRKCIEAFLEVQRIDPKGSWAAAGLFRAAESSMELFDLIQKEPDRKNAVDWLNKIITDYPKSRYMKRATELLAAIDPGKKTVLPNEKIDPAKKEISTTKSEPTASEVESVSTDTLISAKTCYQKILSDENMAKDRNSWLACVEKFKGVYEQNPDGEQGAESLYLTGKLYGDLFVRTNQAEDKNLGLQMLSQVTKQYPSSSFRKPAQDEFASLSERKVPPPPKPDPPPIVAEEKKEPLPKKTTNEKNNVPSGLGTVTQLRFWSNPRYTRIVIDADRQTQYTHQLIDKDLSHDKPPRLFMDLKNCRLSKDADKMIPIDDNLLLKVRAGQYDNDSVRIVLDLKSLSRYKIFSLKDPFKIVLDVWGTQPPPSHANQTAAPQIGQPDPKTAKQDEAEPATAKSDPEINIQTAKNLQLARQLALGVHRIVIDPGHGGTDFGAPGCIEGVHEKDIVLSIAKRLYTKIKDRLGCEVILTRSEDRYLSLEERTAIANTNNADLFISIHTNAVKSQKAYGVETYFLNLATDDESILLAAKENATTTRNISDLKDTLKDLMQNTKIHESSRLASLMQTAMVSSLNNKYDKIKDKGVKQAPFYVLLGAEMPSILVETSFISNERECRRLVSDDYQEAICDAIIDGIRSYVKETNPMALGSPGKPDAS
jgi:N-acetylmuramoyl-L-alanine amidase